MKLKAIDNPWPDKGEWYWFEVDEADRPPPGSCFRCPASDKPDRECWVIILPGNAGPFSTTMTTANGYWNVSGEAPDFTITPSILRHESPGYRDGWHGFVTNGELITA